ncbi:MAG: class I SAM-dependent methyltransferase [Actinomycetaceae bacterium]|nr:class I SAM-dependent methyltransferase [Actinomycetaceae bacterium]MDY6082381.1 class I SAM-dependent methyltransferase [Actinomycetaceae bacterium]
MASDKTQLWAYAENAVPESAASAQLRDAARAMNINASSNATINFLATLTAIIHARNVAEIGTGTGVATLALLSNPHVTVTSIDVDSAAQDVARDAFRAAGIRPARFRLITGRSSDMIPRLASSTYDLVVLDGDPLETPDDAREALRILKPGAVLVLLNAMLDGRVPNPATRDEETVAIRGIVNEILDDASFHASLLPLGSGILVAAAPSAS